MKKVYVSEIEALRRRGKVKKCMYETVGDTRGRVEQARRECVDRVGRGGGSSAVTIHLRDVTGGNEVSVTR